VTPARALLQHGRTKRGYLGVAGQAVTLPRGQRGPMGPASAVLVVQVIDGSPAERAGLLVGDVLTALDDVALESLHAQDESVLNRLLEAALPGEVERAIQAAATALDGPMQALVQAVPAVDPTLEGAARSVAGKINHELQGLHAKIIHAAKRRDETLRRQFTRTRAQAFPDGHAQERTIGFVSFLNRYGQGLIDHLVSDLPLESGSHWVVTV
jgi:uncharacterized protein YllA (UPF0747 family)